MKSANSFASFFKGELQGVEKGKTDQESGPLATCFQVAGGPARSRLLAMLGIAVLTAITAVSSARADLVYEENIAPGTSQGGTQPPAVPAAPAPAPVQSAPAVTLRELAPVSPQGVTTPTSTAPMPVYSAAPANTGDEGEETVSRAELMRRERLREEVKNEDVLQARLEELRLRDEERRTQQILTVPPAAEAANPAPAPAFVSAPVQEQVVVAPSTEHPGQPANQPTMEQQPAPIPERRANPMLASAASAGMSDSGSGGVSTAMATNPDLGNRSSISVQPLLGLSGMLGNTGYQVDPRFSTGVSVGFNASDHFSVDVGYQYSEFGVAMASSNPFVQSVQMMDGYGMDTMTMKQNLLDAGMRYYLLGRDATVRPFVGAGLGYAKSFINYSQAVLSQTYMEGMSPDYGLSQYLGFISAGFDLNVSKNISVGFMAKYYDVFASTEDGYLNNMAFYNPMYTAWQPGSYDKQYVGGSLAGMNFFSVLGDVTFNF